MPVSTRDKIIDAAIDLFSANGYAETSVRDIAQEVGIKTSSIYYHFESKEAILNCILDIYVSAISGDALWRKWEAEKDSIIDRESGVSVGELMGMLSFRFDERNSGKYRKIVKILCSEAVRNEAVRDAFRRHNIDPSFEHVRSVLDCLTKAGKMPERDTARLAGVIYAVTYGFMHFDSVGLERIDEDDENTDMFSLLEYVLTLALEKPGQ